MSRRWWQIARVAFAIALVSLIGLVPVRAKLARAPATPGPTPHATTYADHVEEPPADWAALPVAARMRETTVVRNDDFLRTTRAWLGDFIVEYATNSCESVHTGCTPRPNWYGMRIGDPHGDVGDGLRWIKVLTTCEGPYSYEHPPRQSCKLDSLALRRTADGVTWIVSVYDPDDTEKAVLAFSRTPWIPPAAAPHRKRFPWLFAALVALQATFLLVGMMLLRSARRFFRPGGILSWSERPIARGVLRADGPPVTVIGGERSFGLVLVPPTTVGEAAYRDAPTLDARRVFFASRAQAVARANATAILAAITLLLGAMLGAFALVL